MFFLLLEYKAEHGNCLVSQKYVTKSGYKLGIWVSSQRNNRLNKDQISRLKALGFVWNKLDDSWEVGFSHLQVFKEENGDCKIAKKYQTPCGFKLGNWVSNQRTRKDTLTAEQLSRLEALGFVMDSYTQAWEQGFKELESYKKMNGDCLVKTKYLTLSGYRLGSWVMNQRSIKNKLTPEQLARLESIGFVWQVKK